MGIHEGHRRRVKEKLAKNGTEGFADHELLEALLFYAIPYRDTNPTAHALLDRAGSLASLLRLPCEEIAEVPGCGGRTAEFLMLFAEAGRRGFLANRQNTCYNTPALMRALAVKTVEHTNHESTYLLLFDNRFCLLDSRLLFEGYAGSAALRTNMIAEPALLLHAACAVLVTRHENRIACPDRYERETALYLQKSLEPIGVHLCEHYVVGGNLAIPILKSRNTAFPICVACDGNEPCPDDGYYEVIPEATKYTDCLSDEDLFRGLLSYLMPGRETEMSEKLMTTLGGFGKVTTTDEGRLLSLGLTPHAVSFFGLLLPVWGRFLRSVRTSDEPFTKIREIGDYLTACFTGLRVETVYLLLLDANRITVDCRRVAVGSINAANLTTRALLEAALFSGARYAALAHNHPEGNTTPSESDRETTIAIQNAFHAIGVKFIDHFVIAGNKHFPILSARIDHFDDAPIP